MISTDPRNQLFFGDNLNVLRGSIADASVDLIYLEPPFNSKRQILTVEYLLAGKKPQLPDPSRGEQTFKKARREENDGKAHQPGFDL